LFWRLYQLFSGRENTDKYAIRTVKYGRLYKLEKQGGNDEERFKIAMDILTRKQESLAVEKKERAFVKSTNEQEDESKKYVTVKIKQIITGRGITKENYACIKELIDRYNPNIRLIKEQELTPTPS
jgi:hypothetical protein